MAPGFSFPPPPPPPPRAAPSEQGYGLSQYQSQGQRGGRGGRGGRGVPRGRGGQPNNGGESHQRNQQNGFNQHQNHSQNPNLITPTNPRNYSQGYQQVQGAQIHTQAVLSFPGPHTLPQGAYVNPNFGVHQSYNGGAAHDNSIHSSAQQIHLPVNDWSASGQYSGQKRKRESGMPNGSWKQDQGRRPSEAAHPMKRPPSQPKVQVAPAVPSFGAPIPLPSKPVAPFATVGAAQNPTKPDKLQRLGLVPSSGPADDSDEDTLDEEAAHSGQATGSISFEVNGTVSTLGSEADIRAWIEERKKRWPSKQRVEEKKAEVRTRMDERKRIEAETRAALAASTSATPVLKQDGPPRMERLQPRGKQQPSLPPPAPREQDMSLDETRRELEVQMKRVEELQKRLAEGNKHEHGNVHVGTKSPGDDDGSAFEEADRHDHNVNVEVTNLNSVQPEEKLRHPSAEDRVAMTPHSHSSDAVTLAPSTAQPDPGPELDSISGSDSPSSSSSDSGTDSDSDSAPESAPSNLLPSASHPGSGSGVGHVSPDTHDQRKVCRSFAATGRCKFGARCYFRHDSRPDGSTRVEAREKGKAQRDGAKDGREGRVNGRMTLYQRMIEQEQDEENALALQAIKTLGRSGFFSQVRGPVGGDAGAIEDAASLSRFDV